MLHCIVQQLPSISMQLRNLATTASLKKMSNEQLLEHKRNLEITKKELIEYVTAFAEEVQYVKALLKRRYDELELSELEAMLDRQENPMGNENYVH